MTAMFLPCPHCGYLVALILPSPASPQPLAAARCPRCKALLLAQPRDAISEIPADASAAADAGGSPAAPPPASEPPRNAAAAGAVDGQPAGKLPPRVEAGSGGTDEAAHAPGHGAGHERATGSTDASETPSAPREADTTEAEIGAPTQAGTSETPPRVRAAKARRVPSFVRVAAPGATVRRAWPWYAAIVALGLLLALQLLLAQRDELAASARWRPWLVGVCDALRCDIPAWREPRAFTMLARSVQPSPTAPGVLLVEASFRNDARWPQPWPMLWLSLADVEGSQVGARAFAPAEYRHGARADERLAPGQSATVRLQVREPAPRVVAFTFDFR